MLEAALPWLGWKGFLMLVPVIDLILHRCSITEDRAGAIQLYVSIRLPPKKGFPCSAFKAAFTVIFVLLEWIQSHGGLDPNVGLGYSRISLFLESPYKSGQTSRRVF